EIQLRSTPGVGSTFTLYLPIKYPGPVVTQRTATAMAANPAAQVLPSTPVVVEQIPDDRENIEPGDTTLLVVEDDPHYARVMMDLARDNGFKVLLAMNGSTALEMAKQYVPIAVSLDVFLPDMMGW